MHCDATSGVQRVVSLALPPAAYPKRGNAVVSSGERALVNKALSAQFKCVLNLQAQRFVFSFLVFFYYLTKQYNTNDKKNVKKNIVCICRV